MGNVARTPEYIHSVPNAPTPIGAYSAVTKYNGLIFCSGQIALDPKTGKLIEGDVAAQTKLVLENLTAVLAQAGGNWERILMTSTFLTEMSNSKIVNEIYSSYVKSPTLPARQTLGVKELPLGALVEISIIAAEI